MRKQLLGSGWLLPSVTLFCGLAACAKTPASQGGSGGMHAGSGGAPGSGGSPSGSGGAGADAGPLDMAADQGDTKDAMADAGCEPGSGEGYVLIDDMETTDHGPNQLDAGISGSLMAGYWYNSGATYSEDDGGTILDTSNPPQGSFVFSALSSPTTTLNCKPSMHAAHQACSLNGLYDTCGVGFEFAQQPDPDAGVDSGAGSVTTTSDDAGTGDAGDGPSVPLVTVPFDISRYKALTFWGMTTTPDPMTGSLHVKVQFPDTDTDPRGQVCNGGSKDNSLCYNSYATYFEFTDKWQQFTLLLDAGTNGVPPEGGISIDPSWGFQQAQWLPTQVYGINWQAQRNIAPDAGPTLMTDIWVDDVYFKE